MKSVMLILAAVVIVLFTGAAIGAITDFRSRNYTEPHIVTTGGGDFDADVTLLQDVFNDSTTNVVISSNSTSDAPLPFREPRLVLNFLVQYGQ